MAEYINRTVIESELLTESNYRGFHYNGINYYIGANSIVKQVAGSEIFETVYTGAIKSGNGAGCGSKFVIPSIESNRWGMTIYIAEFDAETGIYNANKASVDWYSPSSAYHHYPRVLGAIYYDEGTQRLFIWDRWYHDYYPSAGLDSYKSEAAVIRLTTTSPYYVYDRTIGGGYYMPKGGQHIPGYYFGKYGSTNDRQQGNTVPEFGTLSDITGAMSDGYSDTDFSENIYGFDRPDSFYFVGGGRNGTFNNRLTRMSKTTHVKSTVYSEQGFAASYAIKVGSTYYVATLGKVVKYEFIPYPNTYKVETPEGEVLNAIYEIPNITKIELQATPTTGTLLLYDENDSHYSMSFPIDPPLHTQFTGVSFVTGATEPDVYVGQSRAGDYDFSITFTIHYGVYDPNHHVDLYQMSCSRDVVDKTEYLSPVTVLYGTFRDSVSMIDPVFTINYAAVPRFNYVFIKGFSRYYFVNEIVNIRENVWQLSCHVDVLHTYRNEIISNSGVIARIETGANPYIDDPRAVVPLSRAIETVDSFLHEGEVNPLDFQQNTAHFILLTCIRRE